MRRRVTVLLTVIAVAAVTFEATVWMLANPLAVYWDEASYYASTVHFARLLRHSGLSHFGTAWHFDPFRPPISLILPLPVALLVPNSLLAMRIVSWIVFLAAALLIGATVRRVANAEAGALAVMMLVASPVLVMSLKMFGTEYPLLLAIAGVLFFAFGTDSRRAWIGLGVSIGLGMLAKTSFAVIIVPLLIGRFLVSRSRGRDAAAVLLGGLIASTWWIAHAATAIRFVLHSREAVPHSLGPPADPHTFVRWCEAFARCVSGYGVLAAIVITIALLLLRRRSIPPFTIATAASSVLLLIAGYSGVNHNPRWLAPAVVLLIAAAASVARPIPLLIALVFAQVLAITIFHETAVARTYIWLGATEVMEPAEQWDFHPVKVFVDRRAHIAAPRIALMGAGYQLNPASIEEAWLRDGGDALSRTIWTDDYDLQRAVAYAATAQVVITAPGYLGDPRDGASRVNVHNAEFAGALMQSSLFDGPYTIDVGVNEKASVEVFLRRTRPPQNPR
ncbi:MAG TPA: glycosyltransferase family 39 protein [Thermoanaerobaculia bacterium]